MFYTIALKTVRWLAKLLLISPNLAGFSLRMLLIGYFIKR
jgi:hypothetical protein